MYNISSLISFLVYFVMGLLTFVILLQLLHVTSRSRFRRAVRRLFRRQLQPVFIEVYRHTLQTPPVRRVL